MAGAARQIGSITGSAAALEDVAANDARARASGVLRERVGVQIDPPVAVRALRVAGEDEADDRLAGDAVVVDLFEAAVVRGGERGDLVHEAGDAGGRGGRSRRRIPPSRQHDEHARCREGHGHRDEPRAEAARDPGATRHGHGEGHAERHAYEARRRLPDRVAGPRPAAHAVGAADDHLFRRRRTLAPHTQMNSKRVLPVAVDRATV